jgi:hypothetical protein
VFLPVHFLGDGSPSATASRTEPLSADRLELSSTTLALAPLRRCADRVPVSSLPRSLGFALIEIDNGGSERIATFLAAIFLATLRKLSAASDTAITSDLGCCFVGILALAFIPKRAASADQT